MKKSFAQLENQFYELNKYLVLMKYALKRFSTAENGACYILDMHDEICKKSDNVKSELDNMYRIIYKDGLDSISHETEE